MPNIIPTVRILVFAETHSDQVLVKQLLSEATLRIVTTIAQVHEALSTEFFDVAICVSMLPPIDVLGAIQEQMPNNSAVLSMLTIVIAEFSDMETIRLAMNSGADDYIPKKLSQRYLRQAINARLERKKSINTIPQQTLKDLRKHLSRVLPHEFRTPMTSIVGSIQFLRGHLDKLAVHDIQEMLEMADVGAKRLQALMEKILLYVNLELLSENTDIYHQAHQTDVQNIQETITEVAAKVVGEFGWGQQCRIEWLVPLEHNIHISTIYLTELLQEVIGNACKFSDPDSPITLKAFLRKDKFVLTVTDEGRGMSAEQIQQLGVFMQFDRDRFEQQGLGLGWAIIKIIMNLFHGSYSIYSVPGKGTTIVLELPSAQIEYDSDLHDINIRNNYALELTN